MHPCRTCLVARASAPLFEDATSARARAPFVGDNRCAGIRTHCQPCSAAQEHAPLPDMPCRVGTCTLAGHALPRRYTSLLPDECLAKESRTFSLWSAPP
ncbi:hypothetical protein Hdeb2414_s0138g00810151 [Helianthus debilis subsp. tardiflorus]